jgi:hypothetical protein
MESELVATDGGKSDSDAYQNWGVPGSQTPPTNGKDGPADYACHCMRLRFA